ncbi:hypothetical protein G9444_3379 [Rhodococcus erythropolis]|uniref:Uncharacterized protein n=1 Tax=Rhodococcus erythropolis TaxID=1833 RepID=A0A6G9CUB6_RHOER|nr:hypothetical protein G9444_3379 [Rhodococcus erythropolis]
MRIDPTFATNAMNRIALANARSSAIAVEMVGEEFSESSARSSAMIKEKTNVARNMPIDHRITRCCASIGTTRTEICDAPNCIARVMAVNTRPVRVIIPPAMTLSSVAVAPASTPSEMVPTSPSLTRSPSIPTRMFAVTTDRTTRITGRRQTGTVRSRRRVRRQRILSESRRDNPTFDVGVVVSTTGSGGGGGGAEPKLPDTVSCT